MAAVTIYHNPNCSKSRQTMALLEENGVTPETILYLETPPDANEINNLLKLLGFRARDLLRTSEEQYLTMNLQDEGLSDDQLIAAMVNAPILIQRPIVISNGQARIGRPPESVLDIL